ncbi:MAG TPA: nucleotide sugar dehydrogenase [Actinomycetota bacterium]|nr:nucleotide sugar dehydrogenase [Actinomycetota bacterium]
MSFGRDVVIIGGCGHVGLPLGIALADSNLNVSLYDINQASVDRVNAGVMPFREEGADEMLRRVVDGGLLTATSDGTVVSSAEILILVVGTPVDDHLNPEPLKVLSAVEDLGPSLVDGQLLVLRSTLYPGVTALVEQLVGKLGVDVDVCFCPERIAEGHALTELYELPQIVSGRTARAEERADKLFRHLTDKIVFLSPEEAELAKLFVNTWRYIRFAIANQLYMISNDFGVDFERIRTALKQDYPRAADMPGPGFAAGPCLLKDTMQLAAFNNNNFVLGHASMMINEGLPNYLVTRLERRFDLGQMTVGLLGMAFKAGSDDIRDSLSYKLKRILKIKARQVLCTDPHVTVDPDLTPLDEVLAQADLLVVCAPHREYAGLQPAVPVIDMWNCFGQGVRV